MIDIRQTELTHPLVQSFSGAGSAVEEVFQHYKMGRYGQAFPEKPYFLLSRCTHALFSLWLAEQESERGFFCPASAPAAFTLGLDFGELRYSEYKRRMLHGDGLEEHLRNETKWFEFWMRLLEQFDASNAPAYRKFCEYLLAWVKGPGFLEAKTPRANPEALHLFMMGHEAGRVLTGTLRVLEDVLRAIVGCFTTSDARTGVAEQMILLTGLLGEMRRILIWETPAQGPYALSGKTRWRDPSPWRRLFRNRAPGFLTVVPKREGGQIACTFAPAPDSTGRRTSWVRSMTSLAGTYEAELFATWSCDSGASQEHPDHFPNVQACWTLQNAEASRLEALSKQIDSLLNVLQRDPVCTALAAAVRRVSRNGAPEWHAVALPWTYINQLDQLVGKLTFVYREAKAVGTEDAAHGAIERIWPSGRAATEGRAPSDSPNRREQECLRAPASAPAPKSAPRPPAQAAAGTLASLLQRLGGEHTFQERNLASDLPSRLMSPERSTGAAGAEFVNPGGPGQARATCGIPQAGAVAPLTSEMPEPQRGPTPQPSAGQTQGTPDEQESDSVPPCGQAEQKGDEAQSRSETPQATVEFEQQGCAEVAPSPEPVPAGPEAIVAPAPQARSRTRPTSTTAAADADRAGKMDRALLRRLLEHHEPPGGTIDYEPLSSAQLRRDLGWSQSKVQCALTSIFGPKPANAYRSKCKNRTICAFLKARAGGEKTRRVRVRAKPQKATKAPRASAKTKARRKSRRRVSV
jgi:hypothetical protein